METSHFLEGWCVLPFDEHVIAMDEIETWEECKKSEMLFESEFIEKCQNLKKKHDKIEAEGDFGLEIEKVRNGEIHISNNGIETLKRLNFYNQKSVQYT